MIIITILSSCSGGDELSAGIIPCLNLPRRYLTIYMDNYFTSIPLFEELRKLNFGAVGTTVSMG
jgi:hypothetical protein